MRWHKITALMYRDILIMLNAKWRLVEMVYFPITTIIIWGFFALYAVQLAVEAGLIVLVVNVFWNFAQLTQSTINIQMQEDVWSGSLKQVLLSGITEFEYLIARVFSSCIFSIIILAVLLALSVPFGVDLFKDPWGLVALLGITMIGSIGMAVLIAAMLAVAGREYGFIAWSALQLFVFFSAPFYPAEVFPRVLQYVSFVMPFTAVFAGARDLATVGVISPGLLRSGLVVTLVYFIVGWPLYLLAFKAAKKSGKLVRLY